MEAVEDLHASVHRLFARDGGLHPPLHVIQSWPRPNFVDPEERGWDAPIALIVVMVLVFIVYFARMWARLGVGRNAGVDDLLMSIAMVPLLGLSISVILAIRRYGFQWHVWDQTEKTFITTREITMAIEMNYMICTTLVKVSILCFYRRIAGSLTTTFVYWVWGLITFCILYCIVFVLLIAFTCTPAVGFFHLFDVPWRIQNKLYCRDEGAIIIAATTISTVQDFIICLLPIFLIWNIQISKRQKLALCGLFGMGTITCVCGVLRLYYAIKTYYLTYDITWVAYHGWIWTALEADLAVICACAPALKIFFLRYFHASSSGCYGASSRRTRGSGSQSYPKVMHLQSKRSIGTSHVVVGGAHDSDVPMSGIKISQGLDIQVEENWDRNSDASSMNLTGLPLGASQLSGSSEWIEGCRTVCATWQPSSQHHSRNRSHDKDAGSGSWA